MQVLGIEVDEALGRRWLEWLAPPAQPFFLTSAQADACGVATGGQAREMSGELRDTYAAWRVARDLHAVWLDDQRFHAAPRDVRARLVRAQVEHRRGLVPTVSRWSGLLDAAELRGQADGHRFVWSRPALEKAGDAVLGLVVSGIERLRPSRHRDVTADTWKIAGPVLPGAEELAGTFAVRSGPNCFGTVMAAAGVPDAAETWMWQEPFEDWLRASTRAGGDDGLPGTVLVWRTVDGTAQHAAVTLGGGWGLHKPSQSWATPRKVLSVRDIIGASRTAGHRLHRYSLR